MVSPGTHLAENHESLPKTNEFQFTKTRSPDENVWAFMSPTGRFQNSLLTVY